MEAGWRAPAGGEAHGVGLAQRGALLPGGKLVSLHLDRDSTLFCFEASWFADNLGRN